MLTINAPVFDLQGSIIVERPNPDGLNQFTRRVSRSALLNGGARISDFGYSPADRTFDVEWTPRDAFQVEQVRRLVQLYGRLIVSFSEGCFIGAPDSFDFAGGLVTVSFLVEEQLNA